MLTRFHARVFALMGLMAAPLLLLVAPTSCRAGGGCGIRHARL